MKNEARPDTGGPDEMLADSGGGAKSAVDAVEIGIGKRLAYFFVPIIISAVWIFTLWLALPHDYFLIIGALILAYFISPFGREVLIPAAIAAFVKGGSDLLNVENGIIVSSPGGVGVGELALIAGSVVFVDTMCSLFLIWNIDLLKKIPKLGGLIVRFEKVGMALIERRKKKELATFGLAAYVSLPFQGSGGVASSVIGLIAGIPRRNVFMAVIAGSIVGSAVIAVVGYYVADAMLDVFGSGVYYVAGLLVLAGVFAFVIRRYWLHRKNYNL